MGPWAAPEEIENVVVVSIDTLRADHLGAYGYDRETSPFLDELAASGVLFDQAVSSAPWTLPAHATLLTGLEPSTHRAIDADSGISASADLAAELFREAGFATAGFVTAWFVSERYGFDRGFDTFRDLSRTSKRPRQKVRAARVVDQGLDWLRGLEGEPFFLFLHFYDVHYDYDPPPEIAELFDTGYRGKRRRYQSYFFYRKHPLKPRRLAHEIAMYDGEIRYVDRELERFWEELEHLGRRKGTLLIVTSDHGEEFFERGSWGHAHTLFDEQVRVPLIFAGAGVSEERRIASQVRLLDLLPTLVEAVGLRRPDGLGGASIWPLLSGEGQESPAPRNRRALLDTSRFDTSQIGLRRGGFKLISDLATGEEHLYDLRKDPGEILDLLGESSMPASAEIVEALRRELRAATLEAVTDRWRLAWNAGPEPTRLRGTVRTDGRFLAATNLSGGEVEISPGGRSVNLDLAAGGTLELVVLPIDAELSLEELTTEGGGPVSIAVGGAPLVLDPGTLSFSAASIQPVIDGSDPTRPALVVDLRQEHLAAESVALDDEARRRLEALGYLVD